VLQFLLDECKFDPDERVSGGEGDSVTYSQGYPLWNAAALGLCEIANLLLDGGANPNVHVDSSGSPVHAHTATSCGRWWNCCGREGDLQRQIRLRFIVRGKSTTSNFRKNYQSRALFPRLSCSPTVASRFTTSALWSRRACAKVCSVMKREQNNLPPGTGVAVDVHL
jgi:ankyrin repeat protein